mmetsp:Transcript_81966/g.254436  ORF Transcript_81966/g.254436 Transcript_81966/m.254436 type:complete len:232 (-) Transcript_81966:20-715(-)
MLKWSFSTSCGIIDLVCARLEFGTTGKAPAIPRCRVHVWVEDQSRGEDAELAYCEGSVTLGNPVGHVRWLGRSRRREAHPAVRGRPCAAEVEAPTVAQSVLGLGAAVMRRFQCTGVDLLADDTGSGRLVQCYERLGMAGTQLLGPVARMNVPPPGSAGRTHARAHACAYARALHGVQHCRLHSALQTIALGHEDPFSVPGLWPLAVQRARSWRSGGGQFAQCGCVSSCRGS